MGEISPNEFAGFIGKDIRLEPVIMSDDTNIEQILTYYMGKNTPKRQGFIIDNLRFEIDEIEDLDGDGVISKEEIEAVKV